MIHDNLREIFGITSNTETTEQNNLPAPKPTQSTDLSLQSNNDEPPNLRTKHADEDYQLARDSLRNALISATSLMEDSVQLARELEKPSAIDAASNLYKTISELSKELINIHNHSSETQSSKESRTTNNVTQNSIYVGTTEDLLDIIEKTNKPHKIINHEKDNQ